MSQWAKDKVQHITCKATPSYVLNNLSYNGNTFAYVHLNEVLLVQDAGKKSGSTDKIITKDAAQVTQAKWLQSNKSSASSKDILVVTTHTNFQVYDSDSRLLFAFTLPNGPEGKQKFARGITTTFANGKTYLLVGTSSGSVLTFETKGKDYNFSQVLKAHAHPLCELASDTAGGSAWASADSNGNVVTWNGIEKDATFAGTGFPCTTLVLRGNVLICGYANGLINIFNTKTKAKVADIAAHSRAINAIDLHPTQDTMLGLLPLTGTHKLTHFYQFVSVSDDSYVNVWSINAATFEVKHIFATAVPDNLLCGVQFAGDKGNNIAITAYDYPQIFVFTS